MYDLLASPPTHFITCMNRVSPWVLTRGTRGSTSLETETLEHERVRGERSHSGPGTVPDMRLERKLATLLTGCCSGMVRQEMAAWLQSVISKVRRQQGEIFICSKVVVSRF